MVTSSPLTCCFPLRYPLLRLGYCLFVAWDPKQGSECGWPKVSGVAVGLSPGSCALGEPRHQWVWGPSFRSEVAHTPVRFSPCGGGRLIYLSIALANTVLTLKRNIRYLAASP
jgi:hypothetical protein